MTDRELLELAAKAAALSVEFGTLTDKSGEVREGAWLRDGFDEWNPLTDDGDALRLAVTLHIDFKCYGTTVRTWVGDPVAQRVIASIDELCGPDPYAATRRAIVRAAAAFAQAA